MTHSRIREHGTRETVTDNAQDRINAIKSVLDRGQYAKIDGTMIDLFTASVIIQVYNALNDTNKAKFASIPAGKMGIMAYELIK